MFPHLYASIIILKWAILHKERFYFWYFKRILLLILVFWMQDLYISALWYCYFYSGCSEVCILYQSQSIWICVTFEAIGKCTVYFPLTVWPNRVLNTNGKLQVFWDIAVGSSGVIWRYVRRKAVINCSIRSGLEARGKGVYLQLYFIVILRATKRACHPWYICPPNSDVWVYKKHLHPGLGWAHTQEWICVAALQQVIQISVKGHSGKILLSL